VAGIVGDLEASSNEIAVLNDQIEQIDEERQQAEIQIDQDWQLKLSTLQKTHQSDLNLHQKQLTNANNTIADLQTQLMDVEEELDLIVKDNKHKIDQTQYNNLHSQWFSNLHTINSSRPWNRTFCQIEQVGDDNDANGAKVEWNGNWVGVTAGNGSASTTASSSITTTFDQIITEPNPQNFNDLAQMVACGAHATLFTTTNTNNNCNNNNTPSHISSTTQSLLQTSLTQLFTTLDTITVQGNLGGEKLLPKQVHIGVYEIYLERLRDLLGFVPLDRLEDIINCDQPSNNGTGITTINTTYGKDYDPNDCRIINTVFNSSSSSQDNGTTIAVDGRRLQISNVKEGLECVGEALAFRMNGGEQNKGDCFCCSLPRVSLSRFNSSFRALSSSNSFSKRSKFFSNSALTTSRSLYCAVS
jgi:hypothetical protein